MINGENLVRIANMGKTSLAEMQRVSSNSYGEMSQTLAQLQQQVTTITNTLATFQQDQTAITEVTTKINTILGSGSNSMTPRQVRRAIRKVATLETQLNALNQVCLIRFEYIFILIN